MSPTGCRSAYNEQINLAEKELKENNRNNEIKTHFME
jgi:hypothetical protein